MKLLLLFISILFFLISPFFFIILSYSFLLFGLWSFDKLYISLFFLIKIALLSPKLEQIKWFPIIKIEQLVVPLKSESQSFFFNLLSIWL